MSEIQGGDWFGLLFLLVSYVVLLLSSTARADRSTFFTLLISISIYHSVAVINSFFITIKGAGNDAHIFHERAAFWASYGEWVFSASWQLYVQFLGTIYDWFGASKLLGSEVSILAMTVSAILFVKLIRLLHPHANPTLPLVVFLLLPSMVFRGSVTFREPFIILFFILTIYLLSRYLAYGARKDLTFCILSLGIMSILHKALVMYGPLLFIYVAAVFAIRAQSASRRVKKYVLTAFTVLLVGSGAFLFSGKTEVIGGFAVAQRLVVGDVEFMQNKMDKKAEKDSRTTYNVKVDLSSATNMAYTVPLSLAYYLFAPFPWQVTSLLDVYALLESILRLALIIMSIKVYWGSVGRSRQLIGGLLFVYFSMALMWSLGTSNYGTAIRHNIVHTWLLVIVSAPLISSFFSARKTLAL